MQVVQARVVAVFAGGGSLAGHVGEEHEFARFLSHLAADEKVGQLDGLERLDLAALILLASSGIFHFPVNQVSLI